MTNKRKAAPPIKAATLGETASKNQIQVNATTEFDLQPDYNMANRFFEILTGSKDEAVTFQFFTDNKAAIPKGGRDPLASHPHKNRPIDFKFADKKQSKGAGVWAMVNAGDGGRSKKNVVRVRALFVDLDGSPWEPAATALKPHMRVESSPGRWHLYWLVDDCPLEQLKPIQQSIATKFNGDKSCCDLSRVLRVPGFYHLKKEPVMTRLVEANEFPRYTTQEIIESLGLDLTASYEATRKRKAGPQLAASSYAFSYTNTSTGEMIDLARWAAQNPEFDIVMAADPQYCLGSIADGKQHIVCPFAHEHTDSTTDLATFIANANTEHPSFTIHCMHAHCADRDRLEFLQVMLEKGWLHADIVKFAPLELKKPQWVNFSVKEILSSQEWSVLDPRERQIAFDLQFLAWRGDDGTFDDNEWIITRHLGITKDEWIKYREALEMSGWLIEYNGRLTNSLTKREFDKAQIAYSNICERSKRGGLAAQKKLREKKAASQFN